jgi:hypothetical protein
MTYIFTNSEQIKVLIEAHNIEAAKQKLILTVINHQNFKLEKVKE